MIWDHCNSLCLLNTLMSHQCSCVVQTPFHFDLFFLLKPEPLSGSPLLHSCLYAFILGNLSAVAGFRVYRNNYCVQTSTIPNSLSLLSKQRKVGYTTMRATRPLFGGPSVGQWLGKCEHNCTLQVLSLIL